MTSDKVATVIRSILCMRELRLTKLKQLAKVPIMSGCKARL